MQKRAPWKLLNLKLSCDFFCLYLHEKLDKGFEVLKNIKILRFDGDWDGL